MDHSDPSSLLTSARQLGGCTRPACHTSPSGFGSPGAAVGDWDTLVRRVTERYAPWNDKIAALTPLEVATIRGRLVQSVAAVTDMVSPMLTHRDLYLANVLVNEGRFAAILDFELAKGYDPLLDFVKLGHSSSSAIQRASNRSWRLTATTAIHWRKLRSDWRSASRSINSCRCRIGRYFGEEQLLRDSCQRLRDWLHGRLPSWVQRIGVALA
jgi:aminoglycoside phosphotransferase (APT) family kinase protein